MTETRLVDPLNSLKDKQRIRYNYVHLSHENLCDAFLKSDSIIRDVATQKKALIIDDAALLNGKSEAFLDHVHFSLSGATTWAQIVSHDLSSILDSKSVTY